MGIFHRKNKWERFSDQVMKRSGRLASGAARSPSVKVGAAAAGGAVVLTAASAAVSAIRKRTNP